MIACERPRIRWDGEHGSTLWGSTDLTQYDAEHKHLLYAENADNIAIAGSGAIDGNGPRFWDGGRLERWLRGESDLPRTADMIRFDGCENITIEDVQVRYGAFWNIGFGHCRRIAVRGLTIINGIYEEDGPNTDGINLWHCTKVRISDCDVQTGDDCIVVLGESRDVTITNCQFTSTETALMISGVRNLTFSNCTIHDARLMNVGRAFVHGCRAPACTGVFLSLETETGDVTLTGNELSRAQQAYTVAEDASPFIFEAANRHPE